MTVMGATRRATLLSRQEATPYTFFYGGFTITVERDVFPPDLSATSLLLFDVLSTYRTKRALDMGCGTGILALQLSRVAESCIAVDRHRPAVLTTRNNLARNRISNVAVVASSLFDALSTKTRFDLIVFNQPYYPSRQRDTFGIDHTGGWRLIRRFLKASRLHCGKEGRVVMPFSSFVDPRHNPAAVAASLGMSVREIHNLRDASGVHHVFEITPGAGSA